MPNMSKLSYIVEVHCVSNGRSLNTDDVERL